jgi:hypothetical protein
VEIISNQLEDIREANRRNEEVGIQLKKGEDLNRDQIKRLKEDADSLRHDLHTLKHLLNILQDSNL